MKNKLISLERSFCINVCKNKLGCNNCPVFLYIRCNDISIETILKAGYIGVLKNISELESDNNIIRCSNKERIYMHVFYGSFCFDINKYKEDRPLYKEHFIIYGCNNLLQRL